MTLHIPPRAVLEPLLLFNLNDQPLCLTRSSNHPHYTLTMIKISKDHKPKRVNKDIRESGRTNLGNSGDKHFDFVLLRRILVRSSIRSTAILICTPTQQDRDTFCVSLPNSRQQGSNPVFVLSLQVAIIKCRFIKS